MAHSDVCIATRIEHTLLSNTFLRNPQLAVRFYRTVMYDSLQWTFCLLYAHNVRKKETRTYKQCASFRESHTQKSDSHTWEDSNDDPIIRDLMTKLKLCDGQVILGQYPCKLGRDVRSATIVLLADVVIVFQTILGFVSNQARVPYCNILSFQLTTDRSLEIQCTNSPNMVLEFAGPAVVGEVVHLLSVLVHTSGAEQSNTAPQELTPADWEQIHSFGKRCCVLSGFKAQRQGTSDNHLYLVEKGTFNVQRHTMANDTKVDLGVRKPGSYFGEFDWAFKTTNSTEVTALEDGSYYQFDSSQLDALQEQHPLLFVKFLRQFDRYLLETVRHIELGFPDVQ